MASRSIQDLSKELQPLASKFLNAVNARLASLNAVAFFTCTYRTNEEQAELYAIGRTKPGKRVTNAPPGESKHNKLTPSGRRAAEAFDIAITINGKLNWDLKHQVWQIAGETGEQIGLEWAGRWTRNREGPHFQLKG